VVNYYSLRVDYYLSQKQSLGWKHSKKGLKFKAGKRIPFIAPNYYTKFSSPTFHLLILSNNEFSEQQVLDIKKQFLFEVNVIKEDISAEWKALGVTKDLFLLVRPDQYLLSISEDLRDIRLSLERYFG